MKPVPRAVGKMPPTLETSAKEEKPTKLQAENGYITDTTGEV